MTVDEIYIQIGKAIANTIEDNWTSAMLQIEIVADSVVGYTGDFTTDHGQQDLSVRKISRGMRNWLRTLYEITTAGGHNRYLIHCNPHAVCCVKNLVYLSTEKYDG